MKIIQAILKNNPCYKAGKKITVTGLMLHSVGCPQPSAQNFVKLWNSESYDRACVHAFIDGNTGDVYQTLPWNHRGWHGGGSCNNTHIGVEMCEPACIKYKPNSATFTCTDVPAAKAVAQRTYDNAVALFAHLCKTYHLDPLADGVIVSHAEGHKRGIASNHGDPEHLWNQLGMGYTMEGFRKAVKAAMTAGVVSTPAPEEKVLYRVQVGAYSVKSNAEAMLTKLKKAGFDGFITTSK
jgi:N-acetylmuramoyl-L-alanine amidase CwlA